LRKSLSVCLVALLWVCSACNGGGVNGSGSPQAPGLAGLSTRLVLFNPDGQEVPLASLRGRPILVAFIDTSCTQFCWATTRKLHEVASSLGPQQSQSVRFVLITYNPLYDGPKRLAKYADTMQLDSSHWTLLTGAPENIDWALRRFGMPGTSKVDNPMLLMNQLDYVFLVAPDGRIVNKYVGPELEVRKVAQDTRTMLAQKTS